MPPLRTASLATYACGREADDPLSDRIVLFSSPPHLHSLRLSLHSDFPLKRFQLSFSQIRNLELEYIENLPTLLYTLRQSPMLHSCKMSFGDEIMNYEIAGAKVRLPVLEKLDIDFCGFELDDLLLCFVTPALRALRLKIDGGCNSRFLHQMLMESACHDGQDQDVASLDLGDRERRRNPAELFLLCA
ncbi:hypothetical protein GLOTRDRAFT_132177 [Gloeophyllum trabeum ATCC 11539]|uniref:Uncharacterized protein n=1 Tax=Gloeophyllum trabeum (strain ATCC 11539 / FP-39264 / Madison 617) TaxID=670483 RepID=S7PX39_GLOTA|nr:uncharacterized protein GLOTRDRAFT_132177 [Gloeophyllum trabeum ATCC 11539]EPQ52053.1 hypothetical protein GLOTRDRAFT_132177 [Gloeophyllum trabeum ATCC 11539]